MKNSMHYSFANVEIPRIEFSTINEGNKEYFLFGEDNYFPEKLAVFAKESVTHNAMIKAKTRGIRNTDLIFANPEIEKFYQNDCEGTFGNSFLGLIANDIASCEAICLHIVWDYKGERIAKIHHLPVRNLRLGKKDDYAFFSKDWNNTSKYRISKMPLFNQELALEHPNQIFYAKIENPYSEVYGIPAYVSALNFIALEGELSKAYLSTVVNAVLPATMLIVPTSANEEERAEFHKDFSKRYQGAENKGRFMLLFSEANNEMPDPVIKDIPSSLDSEQFRYYDEICEQKILTAHGATSPVIAGIPKNGTLGGDGNEIEVAWNKFKIEVLQPYVDFTQDALNFVFKYNFGTKKSIEIKL